MDMHTVYDSKCMKIKKGIEVTCQNLIIFQAEIQPLLIPVFENKNSKTLSRIYTVGHYCIEIKCIKRS